MTNPVEERFETIASRWQPSLRRLCAGYERDEARREDLFQEILLALWQGLPGFREESRLRTWMFRVAHNVALRHVGRAIRRGRTGEAPAEWVHGRAAEAPGEALDGRRQAALLSHLIRALAPLDRQIILLTLEELPQSEIAEVTGLSRDNVSTRVHRIKGALSDGMRRRLR
jgi:RNA polymerase sigma-70 factor (ECF subfamily)